ncbi:MAG: hypothetical protein Q8P67_26840 [archaeon]|nr:hypothetical protein [archaeon]
MDRDCPCGGLGGACKCCEHPKTDDRGDLLRGITDGPAMASLRACRCPLFY